MKTKFELKEYNKLHICPDCTETKNIVLVEVQGIYDGALYFQCQHCPTAWHRFPKGDYIREKAEAWLKN